MALPQLAFGRNGFAAMALPQWLRRNGFAAMASPQWLRRNGFAMTERCEAKLTQSI
jgi:hypothetical protein